MPTGAINGKSQIVAARVPLDLARQLHEAADRQGVPYSQLLIAAIREYLQKEEAR